MKRYFLILTAALMALAMAAGCAKSASTYDSVYAATGAAEAPSMPTAEYENGYSYNGEAIAEESRSQGATDAQVNAGDVYGGRKIIRNYELSIETDDFDAVYSAINERLAQYAGYAENSYIDGKKPETYGESGRTASMTLRVPADKADEFIKGVQGMGTLTSSHDYIDDITDAYYDVDTRLEVLNIQLDRLESILVKTDNLADVIALEDRISEVMLEIEQLTGTLKKYDSLIDYTSVSITLYEKSLIAGPAAKQTTGERISNGFTESLYGVGTFFTDLFVWFVSALPVIVILALVGLAALFIIKAVMKRRATSAAKAAVKQQILFEQQKAAYMAEQKKNENHPEGNDCNEN